MRKIVGIVLFLVFGIFSFVSGFIYSNLLIKKNQSIGETRKADYENKFLDVSGKIIENAYFSLSILGNVSSVWSSAIGSEYRDFNIEIRKYLDGIKHSLEVLDNTNTEIEKGMQGLKNYPIQYQEAYTILMELYGIYSQLYSLAISPSGSLMSFNNKVNDLESEFVKIVSKLKIYMPALEEEKKLSPTSIEVPRKR